MSTSSKRSCVACYSYDERAKGAIATPCCSRFVCGSCARSNPRLAETCILCQLPIPSDLSRDDEEDAALPGYEDALPAYGSHGTSNGTFNSATEEKAKLRDKEESEQPAYKEAGVQHFVRKEDSVASLSLAYHVAASDIRKANHLFSDSLLQGRSFIIIPGAAVSLSASPDQDEIEKVKLKKFMVAVKCTDYDMAKSMSRRTIEFLWM